MSEQQEVNLQKKKFWHAFLEFADGVSMQDFAISSGVVVGLFVFDYLLVLFQAIYLLGHLDDKTYSQSFKAQTVDPVVNILSVWIIPPVALLVSGFIMGKSAPSKKGWQYGLLFGVIISLVIIVAVSTIIAYSKTSRASIPNIGFDRIIIGIVLILICTCIGGFVGDFVHKEEMIEQI